MYRCSCTDVPCAKAHCLDQPCTPEKLQAQGVLKSGPVSGSAHTAAHQHAASPEVLTCTDAPQWTMPRDAAGTTLMARH